MGMDYRYAGSATYPRFDRELCAVAEALGAVETEHLKRRRDTEDTRPLGYWFGFLSSDGSKEPKFAVPESIPAVVARWLNDPYKSLTPEETAQVWAVLEDHPEAQGLSPQIWEEMRQCAALREGWDIS